MNSPERFNGSLRLRRKFGMRGYGVYSRLVELVLSSPNKRVPYDLGDFAFDMSEDEDFIKQVVEDFGLFDVKDGFLEDPYTKTPEAVEAERQAKIRANRSEGAKKAAATRRAKKEAAEREAATIEPVVVAKVAPLPVAETVVKENLTTEKVEEPTSWEPTESADPFEMERSPESILFDKIKDEWNAVFGRTYRRYVDLTPSSIVWENFKRSSEQYELDDFKDAFKQASREKFGWQFKDVLKPSNMQRLLSNFEIQKKVEAEAKPEPQYDFETQELIKYGEARGWNWAS